ncbi:molybdopterin-guanine dinucleotide biosynthesis protein B [Methanocaldococcus indicus]|uniref:molybdopterin-guanine dinucleotide biosynthesis protein B n=1 Tax=Methanocaldococcus indicus TaxID=213231 RepID=UPI003C6D407D
MRVIGIIGYKNSGKTTLIENILKNSNYKIGVVKHSHVEDKGDTQRFFNSGAEVTILSSDEKTTIFTKPKKLENILSLLLNYNLDFVLIEGFKEELTKLNIPKIVMLINKEGNELIDDHTVYVIEDYNYDINEVLKIIEEKAIIPTMNLNCGHCGYNCYRFVKALAKNEVKWNDCVLSNNIRIVVDDKIIPTVPFVSKIVTNTILGLITSLKGVNNPKTIKITIKMDKNGEER